MKPITVKEHLDLIVQFIETQLLELEKKRTPGKWIHKPDVADEGRHFVWRADNGNFYNGVAICVADDDEGSSQQEQQDADFIAAAGNNAAKGWRITLKTIKNLVPVMEVNDKADMLEVWQQEIIQTILAEFPVESLHT